MRILYCTMSLVETSCVMPKVGLGDETNLGRIGPLRRRRCYCKSTLTKQCHYDSSPVIVRDGDKSSVTGLSRFITFSISSFLSMDPILTITSQVPN
jgi:hypothetical protein